MSDENLIDKVTRELIKGIRSYYKGYTSNNLTGIWARGYFAGWSEREILALAEKLDENNTKYPITRR
jgi:hypothetical protein